MRWLVIFGICLVLFTWYIVPVTPAAYQVRVDDRDYHRVPSEDTWRYWTYRSSDGKIFRIYK